MDNSKLIELNRVSHDRIATNYRQRHPEIYNPIEQRRLRETLVYAVSRVSSDQKNNHSINVLDYGAGTGNVTRHLLDMGLEVTAADISFHSLELLKKEVNSEKNLKTVTVDGISLSNFADNSFDLVVTYSVLHHVPDYLKIIQEFCRIVRKGGLIVIDHEVCPAYWQTSSTYREYRKAIREKRSYWNLIRKNLGKIISYYHWKRWFKSRVLRQRVISEEGDIHVYPNDHIEWSSIKKIMDNSCNLVKEIDYLVCREVSEVPYYWNIYKENCVDMRCLIMQKYSKQE